MTTLLVMQQLLSMKMVEAIEFIKTALCHQSKKFQTVYFHSYSKKKIMQNFASQVEAIFRISGTLLIEKNHAFKIPSFAMA